ncbi:MAG: hypothetical protein J1F24_03645 [Oscillospiraceae bacterium]|nr:hypothetical protein [Oscillospiraceae bacterium]
MKIIGKFNKLNPLLGLYVAAGLLIAAIPVRLYQQLTIIEQDTGFYKAIDRSVYVMYILAALALCFSYAVAFLAKNIPASKSPYRKNIILALTSILLGVGIVLDVVSAMSDFIINAKSFATAGISLLGTADQGQIPILFETVLGIFAAIYLLVFGISYIDGRTTYSQYKFLAITPFFWAIARLVGRLITKIAYVNVSDLMLEIFGIAFMMIFFMSFARISSGLSNKKAMRSVFASGAVAAFLLGTANIPRLLLLVSGNAYKITSGYSISICDLIFVFFAAAYIINAYKCAKENDSKELLNEYEKHDADMETDDDFLSE